MKNLEFDYSYNDIDFELSVDYELITLFGLPTVKLKNKEVSEPEDVTFTIDMTVTMVKEIYLEFKQELLAGSFDEEIEAIIMEENE